MRNLFCLFMILLFVACGGKSKELKDQLPATSTLSLKVAEVPSGAKLTWEGSSLRSFEYFSVYTESKMGGGSNVRKALVDNNVSEYDYTFNVGVFASFRVVGFYKNGDSVVSNVVELSHPELNPIDAKPFDALYYPYENYQYFFEADGKVKIYDVNQFKLIGTIEPGGEIGYGDFGVMNGIKELYIPSTDGNLYIYNAKTFSFIDKLSVGVPLSAVAFSNGQLFVKTEETLKKPLKVYSRQSKQLIFETGHWGMGRVEAYPGSTTDIVEFIHMSPTIGNYYMFNTNGAEVGRVVMADRPLFYMELNTLHLMPENNTMIISTAGRVYNRAMQIQVALSQYPGRFRCFNSDGTKKWIYAGRMDEKTIEVYDQANYSLVKRFNLKYYPYWIIKSSNGKLYSIGSNYSAAFTTDQMPSLYIEEVL